jgi:hypothetical protein
MLPSEVFAPEVYLSFSADDFNGPIAAYWDVEFRIAEAAGIAYTALEDYQDPAQRTCDICGTLHGTDQNGNAPPCSNHVCQELRAYWSYSPALKKPGRSGGGGGFKKEAYRKRCAWFSRVFPQTFPATSLFQLDPAIRLDALLTLRLLREAHEHQSETC